MMKNYTWDADDYNKHSTAQLGWAKELVDKLNLKGIEDILDLGCGDGKVTAEIAGFVPNGSVIGIDNSQSMINLAKKLFPTNKYLNLSFNLLDAENLPYTNKFDLIFSNAALHWVKDHQRLLASIYKALKSDGKILLQMGGKGNAGSIFSCLNKIIKKGKWREYFINFEFPYTFPDTDAYTRLLRKIGYVIDRINLIPKDMVQDGKYGLSGWIRTTWLPYTDRIPEKYRNEFIDELVTAILYQIPLDENGKAHIAMVRLEVAAMKKG